jgi:polyhydroxybutyrate depolymerase
MALKKYFIIALVAIMAMVLSVGSPIVVAQESSPESSPGLHTGWMMETYDSGTYNRTFEYYIPSGYDGSEAVPLLFSFHGLGSSGVEQIDLTKFDVLAEQEGFIGVFPDATELPMDPENPCYENVVLVGLAGSNIQWNIGLNWSLQYCADIDDVGFVSNMVDWFDDNYNIDASQVYATGMSNGAMFSHYLALTLPGTFAGIAPVCSPLTTNMTGLSVTPVTVIMMMGTDDPIVAYDGDPIASIYSMNDTIDFWLDVDGIPLETEPVETVWGPTSSDSTVVTRYVYSGGTDGTEVILFKVDGGGHTWPGGPQYAPELYIGKVTTHIDGSALIWKHLPPEKYYLEISSTIGGSVTTPGQETFANEESAGEYMFFYPGSGDTVVDLVTTPLSSNWEFVNWTGDVTTIGSVTAATTTITITPDRDYEIMANFQLIEEEEPGGCFIATAAYGTSTAEQLDVLREFRDVVLLESTVGSQLVNLYYQLSPPIADLISENILVKTLVRELLIDPIVWVVESTGDIWRS